MPTTRLTRAFFARDPLVVARDLLGCCITHAGVTVRLTEVEAYRGADDPGSHAYRGRTPRTEVMFGPPGHLYVYFTYGMHWCANVVTGRAGAASAVLLRAGAVVGGEDVAASRRPGVRPRDLARGPARLTTTLAVTGEANGMSLVEGSRLRLDRGPAVPDERVRTGPRVGVRGAGGDGERFPWRYWVDGEESVSPYRPAATRNRRSRRDVAAP